MKTLILAAAVIFVLAASTQAGFDEGVAAYERSDYATAVHEWRPLAEQGDRAAQFMLGVMYSHGQGVPQDYIQAHMWTNLAAERLSIKDRDLAVEYRDMVAKKMTTAQIAEAQRLAREWRPRSEKSSAGE